MAWTQPRAHVMKICILGGGGFVGGHLAARLSSLGHEIVIPCRQRDRVKSLLVLPRVSLIEADIHDPGQLRQLLDGADAAINLVGILHEYSGQTFAAVHAELPGKVADACHAAGITFSIRAGSSHTSATVGMAAASPAARVEFVPTRVGVGEFGFAGVAGFRQGGILKEALGEHGLAGAHELGDDGGILVPLFIECLLED
mgnify:CR=1 FL=1